MTQPRRRRPAGLWSAGQPQAGFALLEAIVALALLAGAGLAMFAWIQQNLQSNCSKSQE